MSLRTTRAPILIQSWIAAGSVNSNFFLSVRTGSGNEKSYFARIYEEQGQQGEGVVAMQEVAGVAGWA